VRRRRISARRRKKRKNNEVYKVSKRRYKGVGEMYESIITEI